ncbi:IS1182 family transposase, partial [Thermaurantimonas aggregans]|uniref:IS1182 family transposase n=2 Tax=Thermaurantimonas aggregans TaxID=2173829 RepID=UPI001FEC5628
MRRVVFKQQPGKCPELFPENIFDKIPEDHPVRLVDKVVDALDISQILKKYKGGGTSAYHPRMMLKVLFYAYLSNIYSCRKIAKALRENIHFMFISGNSTPDFRTINDFRGKILKDHIKELFVEIVKLLVEMGYVSLEVQYIDGTKIEARSNKYSFVWRKTVEKNQAKLQEKIKSILNDIEQSILSDNRERNEESLPQKIDSEALKERLAELNKKLKEKPQKQSKDLEKLQQEYLPRLEKYEKDLAIMGKRNSYSKTDTDATFMRMKDDHMKNGQLKPAYNAQISTENQFITHISIHQTTTDTTTLASHLEGFEQAYGKQSQEVVADAGYGSEENYELMQSKGIEAYVKYNYFHQQQKRKHKNNPFLVQNLYYNQEEDFYVCPMGQRMHKIKEGERISDNGYISQISYYQAQRCEGCPLRSACHKAKGNRIIEVNHRLNYLKKQAREKLLSSKGLLHRSKRPVEVEAVFAQLKSNNKFNRFSFFGLEKVTLEFLLMAIGHNLRKLLYKGFAKASLALKKLLLTLKNHFKNQFFEISLPKTCFKSNSFFVTLN